MDQIGEKRKPKVVKKRMPKHLWPRPDSGCSNPSIIQVSVYVHTQLQGQKHETETLLLFIVVVSCADSTGSHWHWSECNSRLAWPSTFLILAGVFQRCAVSWFLLLHPDRWNLKAPVWCSSCLSRCSPGLKCPVRRWTHPPRPPPPSFAGETLQAGTETDKRENSRKDEPPVFMHSGWNTQRALVFVPGVNMNSTCMTSIKKTTFLKKNRPNEPNMLSGCSKVETKHLKCQNYKPCELNEQCSTTLDLPWHEEIFMWDQWWQTCTNKGSLTAEHAASAACSSTARTCEQNSEDCLLVTTPLSLWAVLAFVVSVTLPDLWVWWRWVRGRGRAGPWAG